MRKLKVENKSLYLRKATELLERKEGFLLSDKVKGRLLNLYPEIVVSEDGRDCWIEFEDSNTHLTFNLVNCEVDVVVKYRKELEAFTEIPLDSGGWFVEGGGKFFQESTLVFPSSNERETFLQMVEAFCRQKLVQFLLTDFKQLEEKSNAPAEAVGRKVIVGRLLGEIEKLKLWHKDSYIRREFSMTNYTENIQKEMMRLGAILKLTNSDLEAIKSYLLEADKVYPNGYRKVLAELVQTLVGESDELLLEEGKITESLTDESTWAELSIVMGKIADKEERSNW